MKEDIKVLDTGNIKISEDVIVSIVTIAANEVEGVSIASASALDFAERWSKKGSGKGIRVTFEEKTIALDLCLQMTYGVGEGMLLLGVVLLRKNGLVEKPEEN